METSSASGLVFLAIFIGRLLVTVSGHGRMMEPPNRSSLWRFPQYKDLDPPVEFNYDDDQNYCGSLGNMVNHGGRCGLCGDPWEEPRPRQNENGGTYGQGLIVKNYEVGQVVPVSIFLTTNHWGSFEWNLCKLDDPSRPEPEDCFDKYPLKLAQESGFQYNLTQNSPGWYNTSIELPSDLTCDHCVLRWHYRAGNNWEYCNEEKEHGSTSCGYQEVFRSCSDISIGRSLPPPSRPTMASTTEYSESHYPKVTMPAMRPPRGK